MIMTEEQYNATCAGLKAAAERGARLLDHVKPEWRGEIKRPVIITMVWWCVLGQAYRTKDEHGWRIGTDELGIAYDRAAQVYLGFQLSDELFDDWENDWENDWDQVLSGYWQDIVNAGQ